MSIEKFLPHRAPARMIDAIIAQDETGICCKVGWPTKSFFHETPHTAMVEMIAQCSAVMMAQLDGNEPEGLGMLTAIKNFEFLAKPLPSLSIEVEVKTEGELGQHKIVTGIVRQQQNILAKGRVFLYLDQDQAALESKA